MALCYGWIDGIRRTIDGDSYTIRFTPRKPRSMWSAINVKKIDELKNAGLMRPAGLAVFEARDATQPAYSVKDRANVFKPAYERQFRANKKAWSYSPAGLLSATKPRSSGCGVRNRRTLGGDGSRRSLPIAAKIATNWPLKLQRNNQTLELRWKRVVKCRNYVRKSLWPGAPRRGRAVRAERSQVSTKYRFQRTCARHYER